MGTKSGQQQQTPAELAQANFATAQMADYQQRWLPVQQKLASNIEQEGVAGGSAQKLAEGKSATDTKIAFSSADTALEKNNANAGAGIGSGRSTLGLTGLNADEAGAVGVGKMMSDQMVEQAYTQGLSALTAIGQGKSAMVGQSMTQEAQQSASTSASAAQASLLQAEGNASLAGQVGGFALKSGIGAGGGSSDLSIDRNGTGMNMGGFLGSGGGIGASR